MYIEGKGNWLNHLGALLPKYNNRVHGTTKMTPFEANNKLLPNNNKTANLVSHKLSKFQVGDFVRVLVNPGCIVKVIQQIGIENFSKDTTSTKQTQ